MMENLLQLDLLLDQYRVASGHAMPDDLVVSTVEMRGPECSQAFRADPGRLGGLQHAERKADLDGQELKSLVR